MKECKKTTGHLQKYIADVHVGLSLLRSFNSALFLHFLMSIPTWNEVSLKLHFTSFCSFLKGVSKPTSKKKTNALITSDKIVSVTHFWIRYHTADGCILCWRRILLALETNVFHAGMNTLVLETNMLKMSVSNFRHTHTASYQQLPNRTYVEMVASHSCSLPKTGGSYHAAESQMLTRCTTVSSVALISLKDQVSGQKQTTVKLLLIDIWFLANLSQPVTYAFSSPGVAWLYMPRPEHINRGHRICRKKSCALKHCFMAVAYPS